MAKNRRKLEVFSRTTGSTISTKLSTKHPWVKGILVFTIQGSLNFDSQKGYSGVFFLIIATVL